MDVLLHKKFRKAKIKTSQGKSFCNADTDADADAITDTNVEMAMSRNPNGQEQDYQRDCRLLLPRKNRKHLNKGSFILRQLQVV